MTQVAEGGAASGTPPVSLPIQAHDLLLGLAGALDDDALADARELLASAELDRALEFLVGCLAAGRISISHAQKDRLIALCEQAGCGLSVAERLVAEDSSMVLRHRFSAGMVDGEAPGHGVADAARGVLDVLPDVRAVWSVWRLTPAGAVSGPVPQRVVLIGVGPGGFAPATSYRVEYALRRNGIRASVEVLRDGSEPSPYHEAAMQHASQVHVGPLAPVAPTVGAPVADFPTSRRSRTERREPAVPPTPPPAPPQPEPAPAPEPSGSSWMTEAVVEPVPPLPPATPLRPADPKTELSEPPIDDADGDGDDLNDQERDLLRQLQAELARREQEESSNTPNWQAESGSHPFDWAASSSLDSTMVNGIPPRSDQRGFPPSA